MVLPKKFRHALVEEKKSDPKIFQTLSGEGELHFEHF